MHGSWLVSLARDLDISIRGYAEGVGVAESTARHHLKAGRIPPDDGVWERIDLFFGIPVGTSREHFRKQLTDEGRIVHCLCGAEVLVFNNNKLCGEDECRRIYDRIRKAKRRREMRLQTKNLFNKQDISKKKSPGPVITQEEVTGAVADFLEKGGKITQLNETVAEGADILSRAPGVRSTDRTAFYRVDKINHEWI